MTTPLTEYLFKLSFDPAALRRFEQAPQAEAQAAGLTPAQQAALLSRDAQQVSAALVAETVGQTFPNCPPCPGSAGSLTVVGTGIRLGQSSTEAQAVLKQAGKVLFLVNDLLHYLWIRQLNPRAESLQDCLRPGRPRADCHQEMVAKILAPVRAGIDVCLVLYGHPGVFVTPSHDAVRQARSEGFPVRMLPAISAVDCLFADLGLDPARAGCHCFDATDFLMRGRRFDETTPLLLWQVGLIGQAAVAPENSAAGLAALTERLLQHYPPGHELIIYEAALYPVCPPMIQRIQLAELPGRRLHERCTLCILPREERSADQRLLARLGLGHT